MLSHLRLELLLWALFSLPVMHQRDEPVADVHAICVQGMKSFSSHVMKVIQKTLFKLEVSVYDIPPFCCTV